jgi:hypothetical protein
LCKLNKQHPHTGVIRFVGIRLFASSVYIGFWYQEYAKPPHKSIFKEWAASKARSIYFVVMAVLTLLALWLAYYVYHRLGFL